MSDPNLKLQIRRDQLTWFLDLLLDEREIFQLIASVGIIPDIDRLYALSRRELLEHLTDAFFTETTVEALAKQFFSEKGHAAMSRVGYMEITEIKAFFKTSDVLMESGEFAEVVWALLTDRRTEVVEHGYRLFNATYEALGAASLQATVNGSDNQSTAEQVEKIRAKYAYDLEGVRRQSEDDARHMEQMEREFADFKAHYTILEKKYNRLDQHCAFLLEENEDLKAKAQAYHTNEKRLKELEQENRLLHERVAQYVEDNAALQQLVEDTQQIRAERERMTAQLKEYERIKAAKETFSADLKLVEEAVYKGYQGLEEFQTHLDSQFDMLQKYHEAARGALNQIRQTITYLDTPQLADTESRYALTSEQPRVGVFVDVQNMFYAAKDRFGRRVDYIKLLDLIVGPRSLMVAYAYVVQIPEINQSSFLSLLEHNGYTIKSKDLRLRGDGSAKGDWDVGIAVDVVSMLGTLDVVILASGDGDFCPLAELIKQQDKRVEVVAFEHNTSMDLQQIADQFFPIGDELLI